MPSALKPQIIRFLRAMIPAWYRIDMDTKPGERPRDGMRSRREVVESLGLSGSLSPFLKSGKGFGPALEDAVIKDRFGGSADAFRKAALAWCEAHPEEPHIRAVAGGLAHGLRTFDWDGVTPEERRHVKAISSGCKVAP